KVQRAAANVGQGRRVFLVPSPPVQRREPQEAIVGAVGEGRQRCGGALPVHQQNETLARFGEIAPLRRETVDGTVVDHQRVAAVRLVNPAQGVRGLRDLGLV